MTVYKKILNNGNLLAVTDGFINKVLNKCVVDGKKYRFKVSNHTADFGNSSNQCIMCMPLEFVGTIKEFRNDSWEEVWCE